MHDAVRDFIAPLGVAGRVVEFGSRDVNGTVRDLIDDTHYVGVDPVPGRNVTLVADCTKRHWQANADWVLCLEVLEHTDRAREICRSANDALKPGGRFVVTCATSPREPHGIDGGFVGDEWYRNVAVAAFRRWTDWGVMERLEVDRTAGDLRAVVRKK